MTRRDIRAFLHDVLESYEAIREFTRDKTFDDYVQNAMLRSAVERQLGIAGEAVKRACEIDPALRSSISGASQIIGFRNRLIHAYDDLDNEVVWKAIQSSLPTLATEARRLLNDIGP